MLEFKAKYFKWRRGHGCNFLKKEEYSYELCIRKKYATLHKFYLIFNNQLQNLRLLPKNVNEKCSNRDIWKESFQWF